MKKGVIVLGGHIQGLNIIRIYGRGGIPVILLDNNKLNLGKYSKYCNKFYKYENTEILKMLLTFKSLNKYKGWLILPTNDLQVKILSQNREELKQYFTISTDEWSVVKKCYNKIETYSIAKSLSIPIPWTIFPKTKQELIDSNNIKYPCIIKPAIMHTFYKKFKKKVFVCNNKKELLDNYMLATEVIPNSEIIIQDIIPGNSSNQYSVGLFYTNGKTYNHIVVRRTRQHPVDFGNATTFAESVELKELKIKAEKILKEIKYNGLCEVEFKYDVRDEEYKLLEINPRTWKWHSISEKAEVPFLLSLYEKMINNKNLITDGYKKSYFKHILLDTIMILLNKEYRKSKVMNKDKIQYAVWDRRDILPAIWEILYFPYNLMRR